MYDLIVIGGGAAGLFGALAAKESCPQAKVAVLEKTAVFLSKVRISGGGRCNVTHACFEPKALAQHYPRGHKELIGPFHRFGPKDTIAWFEKRGVALKTEKDGRLFPVTDSSATIIDCLLNEAKKLGINLFMRQRIAALSKKEALFHLEMEDGTSFAAKNLLIATGSSKEGQAFASRLGHTIISPVPSLFAFNCANFPLHHLSGITLPEVTVSLKGSSLSQTGPFLITHFGFSGPAILKLSAWGARFLAEKNYQTEIQIHWVPQLTETEIFETLKTLKAEMPSKNLLSLSPFALPKNLWKAFVDCSQPLSQISLKQLKAIAHKLSCDIYFMDGKTTHKEEFVTCGGVCTKEVDFKTMQSKICPHLFFAGEILDIDGVTGGFNFQNAWTTSYIAGSNLI